MSVFFHACDSSTGKMTNISRTFTNISRTFTNISRTFTNISRTFTNISRTFYQHLSDQERSESSGSTARIWPVTLGLGRTRTRVALISCSKKRTIAKRELIEIPAMTQSEKTHIYDLRLIHDFDGIVLYSPFYYGYYTSFNGHSNFDQSQSEKTGQKTEKSSYQYNLPLGSVS